MKELRRNGLCLALLLFCAGIFSACSGASWSDPRCNATCQGGTCYAVPGTGKYLGDGVQVFECLQGCQVGPDDSAAFQKCGGPANALLWYPVPRVSSQCSDGIQNGTETDIDCGGVTTSMGCGPTCAPGKGCNVDADCTGGSCNLTNHKCEVPLISAKVGDSCTQANATKCDSIMDGTLQIEGVCAPDSNTCERAGFWTKHDINLPCTTSYFDGAGTLLAPTLRTTPGTWVRMPDGAKTAAFTNCDISNPSFLLISGKKGPVRYVDTICNLASFVGSDLNTYRPCPPTAQ